MDAKTHKEYGKWLCSKKLRVKTIALYTSFSKKINSELSIEQDEPELIGELNSILAAYPSRAMQACLRNYCKFLYERFDYTDKPRIRTLYMIKQKNVLGNITLPYKGVEDDERELKDMYIPADITYAILKRATLEQTVFYLMLYDLACRPAELIRNSLLSIRPPKKQRGWSLYIDKDISKTHKNRHADFLHPDTLRFLRDWVKQTYNVELEDLHTKENRELLKDKQLFPHACEDDSYHRLLCKRMKQHAAEIGYLREGRKANPSLYDLKHSRITDQLSEGMTGDALMIRCGWADYRMVDRYRLAGENIHPESLESYMKENRLTL
jgi:hypothetical protein